MTADTFAATLEELGVVKFAGSVVGKYREENETDWDKVKRHNDTALELKKKYGDKYIVGFGVHPRFVKESLAEIDRMHALGVKLVGELVPYMDGYSYADSGFDEILDRIEKYGMILSLHTMEEEAMDAMLEKHKIITIGAHPGEKRSVMAHIERMKRFDHYYLDISGTGVFRHGMIRYVMDSVGAERILYGSDFPTCNPSVFYGSVVHDSLLSDKEREMLFYYNAAKLLNI